MTVTAQPTPLATTNAVLGERPLVHFIDNLNYLLDWPLAADDVARHLGCKDSAAVEKRLDRAGLTDTPLAEAFRRRKPGYCPECRLTRYQHRITCSEFIPDSSAAYRLRRRQEQDA